MPRKTINILRPVQLHFSAKKIDGNHTGDNNQTEPTA